MRSTPWLMPARWKGYSLAIVLFALDRLTKWVIEENVSLTDSYSVIPGFFDIVHTQNRGVVFGLFHETAGGWQTGLLVVLTFAAVGLLSALLWRPQRVDPRAFWGFAFVLGGAAGNLFDRLVWGQVTDFLLVYVGQYQWPAFNVADSAIVAGSGLLLLDVLRPRRQAEHVS